MDEKSQAAADYLGALDYLETLRAQAAYSDEIIREAKAAEQKAWDRIKELIPDAMCR